MNLLVVDLKLIEKVGIEGAVLYAMIQDMEAKRKLEDGWLRFPVSEVSARIGLNEYKQRNLIKKLVDGGLIYSCIMGLPASRYVRCANTVGV